MVKTICIIQCRMTSTRLPRKAMLDLVGKPLLLRVVERCRQASSVDKVIVATSAEHEDDLVELVCTANNIDCFRGDLKDVRSRFVQIARNEKADYVVRVTADNPLTDPSYIDQVVKKIQSDSSLSYVIMNKKLIPDGTGPEVFTASSLFKSCETHSAADDIEHVTIGIKKMTPITEIDPPEDLRLENEFVGVDTFEDYLKVYKIFLKYDINRDILKKYIADKKERV